MARGADVEDGKDLPPVNEPLQYPEEKDGERGVYDVLVPFGVADGGQLQDAEPRHERSSGTDDVRELSVGVEVGAVERSADRSMPRRPRIQNSPVSRCPPAT